MPFNFNTQPNFGSGLAEGADETLKNFVMPQEAAREQSKLSLQMLSQKLAIEAASNAQAAQLAQARQTLSPEAMGALADYTNKAQNALATGDAIPAMDGTLFKTPAEQEAFNKLADNIMSASAQSLRNSHPVAISELDANGNKSTAFYNPRTRQMLGAPIPQGPQGQTVSKLQAAATQYNQIKGLADSMQTELLGDGTPQNPGIVNSDATMAGRLAQGAQLTMGDIMRSNSPAAKAFMNRLPSRTILYSKIMNGSGRPPSVPILDQESGAIWKPDDSIPDVVQKFDMMRSDALDIGSGPYLAAHQQLPDSMAAAFAQRQAAQHPTAPASPFADDAAFNNALQSVRAQK